jgi:hypothetical protein
MKKVDDVEVQWAKFLEENPEDRMPMIDENVLRERMIKELTYVSAMDVRPTASESSRDAAKFGDGGTSGSLPILVPPAV